MTDAELRDAAVAELQATTITYPEWVKRVENGYKGKPYDPAKTSWGRAFDYLAQIEAVAPPPPPPPPPPARDPAYWPFTSTSPWNHPIGSAAQYAPETSPVWQAAGGVGLNASNGWSIPVWVAQDADPMTDVYQGGTFVTRFRIPANAVPAQAADGHMAVVDENHDKLLETYGGITRSPGRITAQLAIVNSVRDVGAGAAPYIGWHGMRAYGGSCIGGLIRQHEVTERNIPHALAAAVQRDAMNKNTPNGQAYVWPASNADSGWQTSYGSTGNVHMGSLLAIPPSVDLSSLGLNALALAVAKAMQDYGVYIVDAASAGSACVLYAEPPTGPAWDSTTRAGMTKAGGYLQVVTNNSPSSVGGGGTPRRPLAPALT